MLRISESEKEFLLKNLENAETLMSSDNVDDVLLPLDAWIAINGFDEDYDLTDEGRKAQRIYDSIYLNNT